MNVKNHFTVSVWVFHCCYCSVWVFHCCYCSVWVFHCCYCSVWVFHCCYCIDCIKSWIYLAVFILWLPRSTGNIRVNLFPMITSMKSTHGSVPFKHSVVRLYIAAYAKYRIGGKEILCENNTILWIWKFCEFVSVRCCFIELVWWLKSKTSSSFGWEIRISPQTFRVLRPSINLPLPCSRQTEPIFTV